MRGMRGFGWMVVSLVALSGLVGAAAGCGGGSSSGGEGGGTAAAPQAALRAAASAVPGGGAGGVLGPLSSADALGTSPGTGAASGALKEPSVLPKLTSSVIKTGEISLRIDHGKFKTAMDAVGNIADSFGGYTSHSSSSGTSVHDGVITVRVPAKFFGPARRAIERLGRITSENVTGEDVTPEFVDLHARLVNLESQEQVLRRLMTQAQTIAESIRVENYLQQVEFQIEDVQGRILYLQKRTSMSTITVTMHEAGKKPAPPQHASALWKAGSRSLHAALAVVTSVIVGAGLVVPIAILALLAILAGRRLAPLVPPIRVSRPRS